MPELSLLLLVLFAFSIWQHFDVAWKFRQLAIHAHPDVSAATAEHLRGEASVTYTRLHADLISLGFGFAAAGRAQLISNKWWISQFLFIHRLEGHRASIFLENLDGDVRAQITFASEFDDYLRITTTLSASSIIGYQNPNSHSFSVPLSIGVSKAFQVHRDRVKELTVPNQGRLVQVDDAQNFVKSRLRAALEDFLALNASASGYRLSRRVRVTSQPGLQRYYKHGEAVFLGVFFPAALHMRPDRPDFSSYQLPNLCSRLPKKMKPAYTGTTRWQR